MNTPILMRAACAMSVLHVPALPVDLDRPECTGIGIPVLDVAVIVAYVVA